MICFNLFETCFGFVSYNCLQTVVIRYVGLSSTGISYKSSSTSYGGGSYQSSDRYGGYSSRRDGDNFKDSYRDRDQYEEEKTEKDTYSRSSHGVTSESQGSTLKMGSTKYGRYRF